MHEKIKSKFGECLVPLTSVYFPFLASLEKFEYENIQNYNFTCFLSMGVNLGLSL